MTERLRQYSKSLARAGTFVWPHVKSFYHGRPQPGLGLLLAIELARGLLFVAAAWLRLLRSRGQAILFFGAAYSIVGGIAPLLLPNLLMPAYVRLAHGFEVGISNFVFGAILGWALKANSKSAAVPLASPA